MTRSTPFLPSRLPLLPLPPPQLLYPHLQVTISLPAAQVAVVLDSIAANNRDQTIEDSRRMIAVVPVVEIERRVGRWACAARVKRVDASKKEEDVYTLVLEGLARIRLPRSLPPVLSILPPLPLPVSVYSFPLPILHTPSSVDLLPLATKLLPSQLHERLKLVPSSLLADLLITILGISWELRVELLGLPDVEERSLRIKEILQGMMTNRGLPPLEDGSVKIPNRRAVPTTALIRRPQQETSAPQSQIPDDLQPLQASFIKRRQELTADVEHTITRELARLVKIPPQSAEYGVGKTYIEWLLALPWKRTSDEGVDLNLDEARMRLEAEHEGLKGVKRRVIEYFAVYRLKRQLFDEDQARKQKTSALSEAQPAKSVLDPSTAKELLDLIPNDERKAMDQRAGIPESIDQDEPSRNAYRDKGPILLLVGPPGVGKTSIARSMASSLGRKYHRISLGGVRDEAEIRGHRRTYVGALPGMLVQALRKVGVSNPLILLDELDKVGTSNFHGDPSAALLETLDPAQNWAFHDHYLGDVPVDLSQCMFIATANTLDTISPPLLDRCEVIECSGYVTHEKLAIAKRFLLPKQMKENGLSNMGVSMDDEAMIRVITDYTREAGVRSLEREIGKLCRTKAVEFSSSRDERNPKPYNSTITVGDIERILGIARFEQEVREETHRPGIATGMAYQGSGTGGILLIESTLVPNGKGRLYLTGSLGEVIRESAELALTWVKSRAVDLGIENPLKDVDVHLHLPSGAVKKDGPSAGVGMVLAFVSLLTGKSVPSSLAVTGEITLRGAVTAVGGIKEKVLGAHRAGISKVILPGRNRKDVQSDLPDSVRSQMKITFASSIEETLEEVWGRSIWTSGLDGRRVKLEARL